MAYASQSGRARTNPNSPQAHAICDRCGARFNFVDLQWQYEWRGAALQNTRILVCKRCLDTPQEQLRAIVVPADPEPIINARPENYVADSRNRRTLSGPKVTDPKTGLPIPNSDYRITQSGADRDTQVSGPPLGYEQDAIMPLQNQTHYGVRVNAISVTAVGTDQISVTTSGVHGLSTGDQVSVAGTSNKECDGLYSITVTTATAFTYQVNRAIPAGALLTSSTRIVTANVGLPYEFTDVPQTGT